MESFVNRQATNINRKRLNVVDVEHDSSGNVTSLVVDEVRADSDTCTETGTRLDKESIESAIENLIYSNVFGLNFNMDHKKININGSNVVSFAVVASDNLVYARVIRKGRFTVSIHQGSVDEPLNIMFSYPTGGSSSVSDEYEINLYSNSALTNFVCQITGIITYTPSSTGSGD